MALADLKLHLNIDDDHDDALLQFYLEAATDIVTNHVPLIYQDRPPVVAAILITAADLYAFRESISTEGADRLPVTAIDLIAPYRDYSFG